MRSFYSYYNDIPFPLLAQTSTISTIVNKPEYLWVCRLVCIVVVKLKMNILT